MSLQPFQRLLQYPILALIGAGGMGKARHSRSPIPAVGLPSAEKLLVVRVVQRLLDDRRL